MERIRQYSTDTPAPSVAVKIPLTIPPITMMMSSRLGRASRVMRTASFIPGNPEVGYLCFLAYTKATAMEPRPMRMPGI